MDITQKTMKFALSIKLQLLFNFIINIMLKLVIYINGLLLAYKQWGITPELTFNSTTTITYSLPLATTLYINAFMYGGGFNKCVQLPQILSQTSTSAQIYITWATDSAGYYGSVTWLAIDK